MYFVNLLVKHLPIPILCTILSHVTFYTVCCAPTCKEKKMTYIQRRLFLSVHTKKHGNSIEISNYRIYLNFCNKKKKIIL